MEPIPSGDERFLLQRHLDGDPTAFALLMKAYQKPVYSYLIQCNLPDTQIDDVFQEIFIKIHRAAGQYDPERPLQPWLFTIVANTVRSYYRQQKVEALVFEQEPQQEPEGDQKLIAEQTASWLKKALSHLPEIQREVLLLCGIQELGPTETAKILELPLGTVKTHLRRARLALAQAFARRERQMEREVQS
ncbi:MAG: RNA polymerase sigma factor [Acidobacteria bacterium]|nr:RNA polymerase sigma factor [Acidobacteriota bacterium]MCB9397100.1 RNA polymerase sigma factor [Acidobacteriota bacterium]